MQLTNLHPLNAVQRSTGDNRIALQLDECSRLSAPGTLVRTQDDQQPYENRRQAHTLSTTITKENDYQTVYSVHMQYM